MNFYSKDEEISKSISISISSSEWFFLEDYFDIKIDDEIIRFDGKSDSEMGGTAGNLWTSLFCIIDESQYELFLEIQSDIRIRIYTKKGYIDLLIPKEYFEAMANI